MKNKRKPKLCFICSSGGHFSELSKIKGVAKQFDSFLVTEKVEKFSTDFCSKVVFVKEINRKERFFLLHFFFLMVREFFIFIKERPTHIITTGALCAYPMARIAKIFKRKVVYIESYARINDLSLTGKKMYKIADQFYVQWLELIEKYPKAKYYGALY